MPLPDALKNQKDQLENNDNNEEAKQEVQNNPEGGGEENNTGGDGGRVTLSRDEYNDLRSSADKLRSAEGRAEAVKDDMEALKQRLTELESGAKDSLEPRESTTSSWRVETPSFSEEEEQDFGESKGYIKKVVHEVLSEVLPKFSSEIDTRVNAVEGAAKQAADTATSTKTNSFTDKVRGKVDDFDSCVEHKHWNDFVQATEPTSGFTYADLIRNNLKNENLKGMINIFDKFKEHYKISKPSTDGYAGAEPSGVDNGPHPKEEDGNLKFSERKDAHNKYLNREISYEEYQKIKDKFDKADSEGRVDYDS